MFDAMKGQARSLLILTAILALAAAACSSNSATTAPGSTTAPGGTVAASGTQAAAGTVAPSSGADIAGAGSNFANIKSYKFTMTLAGGTFGSMLSMLGSAGSSGGSSFAISGTVVTDPAPAADIVVAGMHVVELGGYDYIAMGGLGFTKVPMSGSGLAAGFSPSKMFSSTVAGTSAGGYQLAGTESKNGVSADHYTASASTLSGYGSLLGVTENATWSSDVWVAKDGGYPVSVLLEAKASGGSVAYEMSFDITNINDPSLTVTAPSK